MPITHGIAKHTHFTLKGEDIGGQITSIAPDEVPIHAAETVLTGQILSEIAPIESMTIIYAHPVGVPPFDFKAIKDADLTIGWVGGTKDSYKKVTTISVADSGVSGTDSKKSTVKFALEKS